MTTQSTSSSKLASHRLSIDSRLSATRDSVTGGGGPRSSTTAAAVLSGGLGIRHGHFVDAHGRVEILRGVNLGGSSKLPAGYGHTDPQLAADQRAFFDGAPTASFVNRPFPLAEADLHFARLRRWGLTFLRVIVTWEAIEHAGPGQYDRAYLTYLRALLTRAHDFGLRVYVDPHQDVWSRWTGGDGAPLWTLECLGLEPRHFAVTQAALCLETACGTSVKEFPAMIWPTNYFKYAAATMFTLFYGGRRLAPRCHVNGEQVQDFLQSHYLGAMGALAEALVGLPNLVGFGTMNEPSAGFIGVQDLTRGFHAHELKYNLAPTPFQGMCLADGHAQVVGSWSNGFRQHVLGRPDRLVRVDPQGTRAWKSGHRCVWMDEGVWRLHPTTNEPELLRPDYFAHVDFGKECYVPFARRFAETIRAILPNTMVFVELPPLEFSPSEFPEIAPESLPRAINATHWYDGVTLFLQTWRPWFSVDPATKFPAFGRQAVRRMHQRQLAKIKDIGRVQMHNAPTLIGETGIPFNLNGARAYRTGDFSAQIDALDHTITCLEANLLSYTLWCYTSDNLHKFGDLWNLEDLSIVSDDHAHQFRQRPVDPRGPRNDDDAAARALLAIARPHASKIAGCPRISAFDLRRRRYELEYATDTWKMAEQILEPTVLHVPHCQYPLGYTVTVSGGHFEIQSHEDWDTVLVHHDAKHPTHKVVVTTKDPAIERQWRRHQLLQQALMATIAILLIVFLWLVFRSFL